MQFVQLSYFFICEIFSYLQNFGKISKYVMQFVKFGQFWWFFWICHIFWDSAILYNSLHLVLYKPGEVDNYEVFYVLSKRSCIYSAICACMMCVFDRDSLVCGIKLSITHIDIYIPWWIILRYKIGIHHHQSTYIQIWVIECFLKIAFLLG